VGLWRYSRHPNYFFEWLVWVGFFVFALGSPMGWLAIVSPMIMFYLLMYVSGVPMAEEQSLKSRGDEYRKYQAATSVFFPMPVRQPGS
jgi:steroid 5-alpha reductase family enzyme